MDKLSLRAALPFWGLGVISILLIFCLCCYLRRLKNKGREEYYGYKTITYSKLKKLTNETCPVCLDDYIPGEKVAICRCKHVFHSKCLNQWLSSNNSCPMCKERVHDHGSGEAANLVHLANMDA